MQCGSLDSAAIFPLVCKHIRMSMRGPSRRGGEAFDVSAHAFAWDPALTATLRHSTLPWGEHARGESLRDARGRGTRDRLSLLAQFAAHQALLQFAGTCDGTFDPSEWMTISRRGADVRLVRRSARACDASAAPPVIALAQEFAEQIGVAQIDCLRQSWARADAIYAEVFARLSRDAASDLQWTRRSGCGAIAAPGPDTLRVLADEPGRHTYAAEECIESVTRFAQLAGGLRVIVLRGASPLERYSALSNVLRTPTGTPAEVADAILGATSGQRHIFVVSNESAFDAGSRDVINILADAKHGTWLFPAATSSLSAVRPFIVAPKLAARESLTVPYATFVESAAFDAYLAHGETPAASTMLPPVAEPLRSYLGVLALLGQRIPCELAGAFLSDFLCTAPLADLAVSGVTRIDGDAIEFESEALRREAVRAIPQTSRAALCRAAAAHTQGSRAALLLLDAGDPVAAAAILDQTEWHSAEVMVEELRRVPSEILGSHTATRLAHALIDCGRYRDARDLSSDELVLARADRRCGDYATALTRLERMEPAFEAMLLRGEVLRLLDREDEARAALDRCAPRTPDEAVRLDYERGLLGADVRLPAPHYLAARLATYRALERRDYAAAEALAAEARTRARNTIERIDASLDRVFAVFSAGRWDAARAAAVEALREVEETQGDRAAGGILYTLAYLAADAGQWAHASQRIARLRQFYTLTRDHVRLAEIHLLSAHLDFSRGRFPEARREAEAIFARHGHHDQIREAAALILDELDWMEESRAVLRSCGDSGNAELTRRHLRLVSLREGTAEDVAEDCFADRLFSFRRAVARGDEARARALAAELDLMFEAAPAPAEVELRLLRAAATREFPFAPEDFDIPWCFATRNRLGQWTSIGSATLTAEILEGSAGEPDWIECSDRERLYVQGSSTWSAEGRDAAAAIVRMRAENYRFRRVVAQEEAARPRERPTDGIIGQSASIREVESLIARVARRDVPVCILGESGTGKELVARALHRHSPRRQKPFTAVNCAALPENLIESELFGHVRGAFTGADRDRAGLIEVTDGGTLFLDEIGELPLVAQAKLLRFLQEGEFRRVGDTSHRAADVRIVSATNRRLEAAVEEGRFREDLYYRVRGVEVTLPPLRERGGDVLLLASHFLAAEREKHRAGPASLSADVEAVFSAYGWPGNVRELLNTIRAAHAMAGESREVEVEHLPERLRRVVPARVSAGSYQHAVAQFKRELIQTSLLQANGNQNRAAAALKMSRQALAYQIRELGILVRS